MMSTPGGQYATDVTDAQWQRIEPLLLAPRWQPNGPGRPPRDRRLIVNGLLYLTKTGCPWALLPACFGPWKTVYDYFRRWSRHGVWAQVLERLTQQELSDEMDGQDFSTIFQNFWTKFAVKGKALTWEGKARKAKKPNSRSLGSERLNAKLAMRHSGLLSADGRLTASGHELLRVGKIYAPDSNAFMELLAYRILMDSRHLNLIFWIEEQNRSIEVSNKNKSNQYFAALDKVLVESGVIAIRKHHAAKMHFIRDEPKLWNKLGLLVRDGSRKYFHKGHGLLFDWRKIVSVTSSR